MKPPECRHCLWQSGWVTPQVQQHTWLQELAAGEKGLWASPETLLRNQWFWGRPQRLPKKLFLQCSWLTTLIHLHTNIKTTLRKFFDRDKFYMISLPIIKNLCDSSCVYHTRSNSTVWCLIQTVLDKSMLWMEILWLRGGGPWRIKKLMCVSSHFIYWLLYKNKAKRLATKNYYFPDCALIFTVFRFTIAEAGVHLCPCCISGH